MLQGFWALGMFMLLIKLQHSIFVVDQKHVSIIDQVTTTWACHGHSIFVVDQATTTWSYHGDSIFVVDQAT
jgi:hypothetical protein